MNFLPVESLSLFDMRPTTVVSSVNFTTVLEAAVMCVKRVKTSAGLSMHPRSATGRTIGQYSPLTKRFSPASTSLTVYTRCHIRRSQTKGKCKQMVFIKQLSNGL